MIEREASINDNSGINMLEILFSNLHKPNCLESLASSNFFSLVSQLLHLNFLLSRNLYHCDHSHEAQMKNVTKAHQPIQTLSIVASYQFVRREIDIFPIQRRIVEVVLVWLLICADETLHWRGVSWKFTKSQYPWITPRQLDNSINDNNNLTSDFTYASPSCLISIGRYFE